MGKVVDFTKTVSELVSENPEKKRYWQKQGLRKL